MDLNPVEEERIDRGGYGVIRGLARSRKPNKTLYNLGPFAFVCVPVSVCVAREHGIEERRGASVCGGEVALDFDCGGEAFVGVGPGGRGGGRLVGRGWRARSAKVLSRAWRRSLALIVAERSIRRMSTRSFGRVLGCLDSP
jgi:hypothetical protein